MEDRYGLPEGLLDAVKLRMDVTWTDERTDQKYADLIRDGMAYLDVKLGSSGDYLSPGFPRSLLMEYVRYARDAALDVFENNYRALILAMRNERRLAANDGSLESAAPSGE